MDAQFFSNDINFIRKLYETLYELYREDRDCQDEIENILSLNNSLRNELLTNKKQIEAITQENQSLKEILTRIESAKFFKFWQLYCNIRDRLLKRIKQK